jgi:DMSO/TMAO reductase YedYZ molybdopterin-dependent catalytic subunit
MRDEVLLAWAMGGTPLPPQHGAPVRLVMPGWYGMAHVKWLREVEVLERPFDGYQNAVAYRLQDGPDDPGQPVTRIRPRALLVPPGWPDFLSRTRFLHPGRHLLEGRAWSGGAPVRSVAVSVDGGSRWAPTDLAPAGPHPWAWRRWTWEWMAAPGSYEVCVRAEASDGAIQPLHPAWNRQGMAGNSVQRVPVTVLDG